jgi:competence protein ComEC
MVGGGPTVVRASIMAIIGMLALLVDRPYDLVRALAIAAVAMVAWNPFVLAHDPGFQLSFVATSGLVLGSSTVERWVSFVPTWGELRTIVAATLATQLAVLPLLLFQIGTVSLVAPLVNVLVVPIVPVIMAVGFAAGVVGMVSTTLALPIALVAYGLLHWVFVVVDYASRMPFASIAVPDVPLTVVALLYALLGLMLWRAQTTRDKPGLQHVS